jgi:hypothetical protein
MYLTIDLNEGVTPMFMVCFRDPDCKGRAHSLGYPKGMPPENIPLLIEFYRPSNAEIDKIENNDLRDFVLAGGLLRRATPDAPKWVKALA